MTRFVQSAEPPRVAPAPTPTEALARASRWLERHGDTLCRARLRALGEAGTALEVLRELEACRAARGLTGLATTLAALDAFDALRRGSDPLLQAVVVELAKAQRADGSWDEVLAARQPDRAVTTGMAAGYLAKTAHARPEALEAAGAYLERCFGPERVAGAAWPALAAFTHFFACTPHEAADAALQWCGRELERGLRTGTLGARQLAHVLRLARASALPGARVSADELVSGLLAEQHPEGSWPPDARELRPAGTARAQATLEAATALVHLVPGAARGVV